MASSLRLLGLASLIFVCAILALSAIGSRDFAGVQPASAADKQEGKPSALPPLVIKKDAPLLLDGPSTPAAKSGPSTGARVANNESCYCCHTNYRDEEFVGFHAKANVGCTECHGESLAHRNDEDNITPPDTMYAADQIAANCKKCHDTHDASAAKVIARWQEKCPARTNPTDLLCTDCHGQHRLKFRTVWWDKKTRQLGPRAEGERIRMAPDLTKVPGKPAAEK
jgi:hypothetical protein